MLSGYHQEDPQAAENLPASRIFWSRRIIAEFIRLGGLVSQIFFVASRRKFFG